MGMVLSEDFVWFLVMCVVPKEEGGLGLINIVTQGRILAVKWIAKFLEGSTSWKTLLRFCFQFAQYL